MTNDLISREAAKEAVKYIPWCDWSAVGRTLDELPSVDAAPAVHGRWIEAKGAIRCSECMNTPLYDYFGKIKLSVACPHCGAKMEVKHEAD